VSVELVLLAGLMFAVTYPSRAIPLLTPGLERLPPRGLTYLRLVGPAVLASLGVTNTLVLVAADGSPSFHLGIETVAVLAAIGIVAWRKNLFLALIVAVATVAIARAIGFP
jgi:branched-subunit amino acid transport protein